MLDPIQGGGKLTCIRIREELICPHFQAKDTSKSIRFHGTGVSSLNLSTETGAINSMSRRQSDSHRYKTRSRTSLDIFPKTQTISFFTNLSFPFIRLRLCEPVLPSDISDQTCTRESSCHQASQ